MSDQQPGNREDFRARLAKIPQFDDQPIEPAWEQEHPVASPRVRRPQGQAQPTWQEERAASPAGEQTEFVSGRPRRRRWPLVLGLLFVIVAAVIIVPLFRARQIFDSVERVAVAETLSPPPIDGVNLLLVGTDSRDGIDGETTNAGLIIGRDEGEAPITGERTDTLMVLRLQEDGSAKFLSLPRDLWLPIDGGEPQRINTAFNDGPTALINTVQSELQIPITHYVQIDLVGFIGLVDAVGGVEVTIENPAFDTRSGLDLPQAGTVTLDSTQALAYVRSRFYTEIINGVEVTDGTSDLGRVQRQQAFMRALFAKVAAQRNPRVLDQMGSALASAVVIDDATSLSDAFSIANTIRTTNPESVVLPTRNATIGGRAVLELTEEAPAVLAQFGSSLN